MAELQDLRGEDEAPADVGQVDRDCLQPAVPAAGPLLPHNLLPSLYNMVVRSSAGRAGAHLRYQLQEGVQVHIVRPQPGDLEYAAAALQFASDCSSEVNTEPAGCGSGKQPAGSACDQPPAGQPGGALQPDGGQPQRGLVQGAGQQVGQRQLERGPRPGEQGGHRVQPGQQLARVLQPAHRRARPTHVEVGQQLLQEHFLLYNELQFTVQENIKQRSFKKLFVEAGICILF